MSETFNGATISLLNVCAPRAEILSVDLISDNRIEIVYRRRSDITYACNPPRPAPDTVWKDVYEAKGDKLVHVKRIPGTHTPAHQVAEAITWPEEEGAAK